MNRKFLHNLIRSFTRIDMIVMVLLCLVILWLNVYAGIFALILVASISLIHARLMDRAAEEGIKEYEESVIREHLDSAGLNEDGTITDEAAAAEINRLKKLNEDSQSCIALINIDNYDELLSSSPAEEQSTISAEIDKKIRSWTQYVDAAVTRVRSNRYYAQFEQKYLAEQRRSEFPIINQMHEIETQADFPTSLSIGIGVGGGSFSRIQLLAEEAMDLALGRGGDQVVIKHESGDIEYFGGSLPTVEKRNKGRARIMAHALMQLVKSSDRVFIMGHARPDLDSIGSAIGMYTFAKSAGVPTDIILDNVGTAIDIIYGEALKTGRYSFISGEKAQQLATENTLVILVDSHIPAIAEYPPILQQVKRIAVIDHHRKSKDAVENPTLMHMETYASSASELVTELLQYAVDKSDIDKFDADALLAGITVDTKGFAINTGVRTFDAASWLRRMGADNANVRSFFKLKLDFVKKKSNIMANAEILGEGVAVAYTKDSDPAMQILVAQAADELLDVRGVHTAFAAGRGKDLTMVSARSTGQVNVQTVMEKLGGGGHLNIAAAQVQVGPEEAIAKVVAVMREAGLL
ncbi:MAG: DHH family phosphoesterase [Firmicutes bacterium]|nr:DHH family phosphoesterase [Bacillota bacterium]